MGPRPKGQSEYQAILPLPGLNLAAKPFDIESMTTSRMDAQSDSGGFWARVATALAALARMAGCSVEQSMLPELREVARDLRDRGVTG
jgi:hypothetical protein